MKSKRGGCDLVDLRLFVNIAEADSLTKGAARTCLSVPAASLRIKNLEAVFGTRMLERAARGVTLTPAGQALLHHARLVLQHLEYLNADIADYAHGVKGHVRILANTTAITEFLPLILRRYLASHPDVSIDLRERLSHDIIREVSEGRADIGIVAGNVRTEDLEVLPYRRDRLVVAVSPQHELAGREVVAFAETLGFDHVALTEASAIHLFLTEAARHLKLALRVRIHVGNFDALCRMIEANVGVGVLPESAARRHAQSLEIRIVPLIDAWALRNLQICVRRLAAQPAFARELVELMVADCAPPSADRYSPAASQPSN